MSAAADLETKTMTTQTLYFAYGSNLDPSGMEHRCPAAVVAGRAALHHWRLTFRGVADVEPAQDHRVEGLLWECTEECVRSLDRYEGVAGGFYRQEWLEVVREDGSTATALVYVMEPTGPYDNASMPSQGYLGSIARGYEAFGIDFRTLADALEHTEARCHRKGVTRWRPDPHSPKRMRPVGVERKRHGQRGSVQPPETKRQRPASVKRGSGKVPAERGLVPVRSLSRVPRLDLDLESLFADGQGPTKEQAARMGISPATLADLRMLAKEEGWLS